MTEIKVNAINSAGFDMEDADLLFLQSIKCLEQIKLVLGGQALYSTLRKRKILRKFLEDYIKEHHSITLNTIEESIASL